MTWLAYSVVSVPQMCRPSAATHESYRECLLLRRFFNQCPAIAIASGKTGQALETALPRQTPVPRAARQPAPSAELCAEVSTGIGKMYWR